MKTTPLILTIAAVAVSALAQAEPEKTKGYELKNRSAFHVQEDARIPFWPIGFQRPPKGSVAGPVSKVAKIRIDPAQFNLTSVLLGNPRSPRSTATRLAKVKSCLSFTAMSGCASCSVRSATAASRSITTDSRSLSP